MLIARRSRAKIAQDPFRMGAQLPTEHALCRCYRLSRFIVREAMSMLSAAGPSPCRQRRITHVLDAELMRRTSAEWMPCRTFAV